MPTGAGNAAGARVHKYRSAVLAALDRHTAPVSAQTLHASLRATGQRVGLSTVYRELHALIQTRQIAEAFVGGETVYLVSEQHLLICDSCGRIEELAGGLIPPGALDEFFSPERPMTIHGLCRLCAPPD